MLRSAIRQGDPTGLKAKSFIERGELVPDDVMIELIERSLGGLDAKSQVILDGFPRTVPQADALDKKPTTTVNQAISFLVDQAILVQRLTGRRICEKCGESFHTVFLPPKSPGVCDRCGNKLIQRADDSENVVRRRLEIFHQQNSQLLEYYSQRGKLLELNADQPVETIQSELIRMLQ